MYSNLSDGRRYEEIGTPLAKDLDEYKSKDSWPIRNLYSHLKRRGVYLDNVLPFECFREVMLQRYRVHTQRRLAYLQFRIKKQTGILSKTSY
ncbi:MAG: hypothetical protein NE334_07790 [Lentisphaeraceae bacterium]|nr:hypothetical protein [Lentisphaeraceae bacterium]